MSSTASGSPRVACTAARTWQRRSHAGGTMVRIHNGRVNTTHAPNHRKYDMTKVKIKTRRRFVSAKPGRNQRMTRLLQRRITRKTPPDIQYTCRHKTINTDMCLPPFCSRGSKRQSLKGTLTLRLFAPEPFHRPQLRSARTSGHAALLSTRAPVTTFSLDISE